MPLPSPLATLAASPIAWRVNARARRGPYGPRQASVLSHAAFARAKAEITRWPGYAPTPLLALPGLAKALGIGALWFKDEGKRFGLKSFKALGGAYAVLRQVQKVIAARTGIADAPSADIAAGKYRHYTKDVTVACATDGNHGRSVAWGAATFGCRCVITIHAGVSQGRADAIARYGAEVRRIKGNYDDSVRQAAEDAKANGWIIVSDTSWPGYMEIPKDVMQGYALMADEAMAQLGAERPTHLFLQAGVGGMAAAVAAHFWEAMGAARPRVVLCEPDKAACLFASVAEGRAATIAGDLDTVMAGLAAGETSPLAWEILEDCADAAMTVGDAAAGPAMQLLAAGVGSDPPVVAGESAVCTLGCLAGAMRDPAIAKALELDARSTVLLFGSEGDTDPALYETLVGRPADQVRAA
ncbi:MAG: diaminopropionate ammonia-lyase [Alphaproteobacteria bacterium]|nr:diaminopropionate ammonia-lyase [Alphaproteobacteria bacterium]